MKSLIAATIAFVMVAPSVAFAAPSAQSLSLSLSNAAVQPVRASAKTGKKLKAVQGLSLIIGGILIAGGGICALACGGSKSK
jgi:hypothetical protein